MDAYVQLTGNVGGSVEFRNNGVPVASFRLAHTPRVRRNGEWADAATTWITVTCFRALAENVKASVHKGQPVGCAPTSGPRRASPTSGSPWRRPPWVTT